MKKMEMIHLKIDNKAYAKAYKEVLEIIKYFPEEEYNKIPQEKIEFFKQNMDKHYYFQINPNIDLSEQKISKEANAIIVNLYFDYFASDMQREKINKVLEQNNKKLEQEKCQEFDYEAVFKKADVMTTPAEYKIPESAYQQSETTETALVEQKEGFFAKFKNFINELIHRYF